MTAVNKIQELFDHKGMILNHFRLVFVSLKDAKVVRFHLYFRKSNLFVLSGEIGLNFQDIIEGDEYEL